MKSTDPRYQPHLERVLGCFRAVHQQPSGGWSAICPVCDAAALSITADEVGIGLRCHYANGRSGEADEGDFCDIEDIVAEVGLRMIDLFFDDEPERRRDGIGDAVPYRLSLRKATGSTNAALILNQIIFWSDGRGGVRRYGYRWIAKSYAEWCDELGLTRSEAESAVKRLREKGFIVTEDRMFRGRKVLHYRVAWEVLGPLLHGNPAWIQRVGGHYSPVGKEPTRATRAAQSGGSLLDSG